MRARHVVEDAFGEIDVGDIGGGGDGKGTLGGGHRGEAPENLVVVALPTQPSVMEALPQSREWRAHTSWPASSDIMKSSVGLACASIACDTTSL